MYALTLHCIICSCFSKIKYHVTKAECATNRLNKKIQYLEVTPMFKISNRRINCYIRQHFGMNEWWQVKTSPSQHFPILVKTSPPEVKPSSPRVKNVPTYNHLNINFIYILVFFSPL